MAIDTWQPMSIPELEQTVAEHGRVFGASAEVLATYRVPLHPVPLRRSGAVEMVLVVAHLPDALVRAGL